VCGNGICESGETQVSCATDCKPKASCGNASCEAGEAPSCVLDCNAQVAAMLPCVKQNCGSNLAACLTLPDCAAALNTGTACAIKCGQSEASCLEKCLQSMGSNSSATSVAVCTLQAGCYGTTPPSKCGNGFCDSGETSNSCPADCKPATVCGNGTCESGETASSCPYDCALPVSGCGNGSCDKGETATSCALDCDPQIASMLGCVKTTCPAEYGACVVDSACISAANAALACVGKCAKSDFMCMLGCQTAGGSDVKFSALTQCGLTCFLGP